MQKDYRPIVQVCDENGHGEERVRVGGGEISNATVSPNLGRSCVYASESIQGTRCKRDESEGSVRMEMNVNFRLPEGDYQEEGVGGVGEGIDWHIGWHTGHLSKAGEPNVELQLENRRGAEAKGKAEVEHNLIDICFCF